LIRALALTVLLAGCATEPAMTQPAEPGSCDVEVTFGSFGMGADQDLRTRVRATLNGSEGVRLVDEQTWGREGESTLCVSTTDEPAADRIYDQIAGMIPDHSRYGPTTVTHSDGRSHASMLPPNG